jgi:hypothetical protein
MYRLGYVAAVSTHNTYTLQKARARERDRYTHRKREGERETERVTERGRERERGQTILMLPPCCRDAVEADEGGCCGIE